MSFKAMAWAYEQVPEPAPEVSVSALRLTLLGLANYANDGEEPGTFATYVGVKRLAQENGLGERTVRRAIEALEAQGLLVRTRRRRQDGTWSTYRYALAVGGATSGQDGRWVEPPAEHESEPTSGHGGRTEPQTPTSLEPQAIATREPDYLFEAVADACGIDWHHLTKSSRGPLNRAVSELRALEALPDEVHSRAAEFRRRYSVPLTPTALAKHWPALGTPMPLALPFNQMHPTDQGTLLTLEQMRRRREQEAARGRPDGSGAGEPASRGLPEHQAPEPDA